MNRGRVSQFDLVVHPGNRVASLGLRGHCREAKKNTKNPGPESLYRLFRPRSGMKTGRRTAISDGGGAALAGLLRPEAGCRRLPEPQCL
jgi:hypothetical protein